MRKHLLLSIFISTVNIIEPTRAPKPPNVPTKPSCSSVRERSDFIFEIPELNTPPVMGKIKEFKLWKAEGENINEGNDYRCC